MRSPLQKNSFWTGLSIVIALFMCGLYGIMLIHTGRISQQLKQQLNVVVEFAKEYSDADKSHLFDELSNHEGVLPESLNFYTSQDAKSLMAGELAADYFSNLEENPFHDIVTFHMKHDYYSADKLSSLKQHLLTRTYVSDVVYAQEQSAFIENNLRRLSFIPLIIALLMAAMSVALIYNTIRLNLQTDETKIRTMKLVGANNDFIKKPYSRSAIKLGLLSALFAIFLLLIIVSILRIYLGEASDLIHYPYVLIVAIILLVIGILVPFLTTNSLLSTYLRKLRLGI